MEWGYIALPIALLHNREMTASIIDGKQVASEIRNRIKQIVSEQTVRGRCAPGLAVVIVGDDSASHIYVNNKRKACTEVGFNSYAYNLPATTSENELLTLIDTLNESVDVDGILVQLPLPPHINTQAVIEHISPKKDVDGFIQLELGHNYNQLVSVDVAAALMLITVQFALQQSIVLMRNIHIPLLNEVMKKTIRYTTTIKDLQNFNVILYYAFSLCISFKRDNNRTLEVFKWTLFKAL